MAALQKEKFSLEVKVEGAGTADSAYKLPLAAKSRIFAVEKINALHSFASADEEN